jgi:GNAT superfamily N-acetyltransferase
MIKDLFIEPCDPQGKDALELTQGLFNELEELYGPSTLENFIEENGKFVYFLVVKSGHINIASGGVNQVNETTAEIKRMFVKKGFRGKGLSKLVLNALEEYIRIRGYKRIILETGGQQPEAMSLYRKFGYTQIPCYDRHSLDPNSVCFGKDIPIL